MWSLAAKQTDDVPSIECAGASESDLVTFAQAGMGLARLPESFTASLTLERGVIKVCKRACAFDPRAAGPTNAPMCCPQPGVAVVTPTGARNYLSHGERLPSQLATTTTVTPASTYGHSCGQQRYETGATWRQHGRTWPTLPSHHAVTAAATAVTAASAHTTTDTAINTCRHSTPRTPGCTPLNRTAVPALTPGVSASLAHKKSFTVRDFNCGHTAPATTVTPHQHHGHTSNTWLRAAPGRVCGARARCQTRKARLPEKSVACMQGTFMLAAALLGLSLSATTLAAARPPWTCARLWPASRAGSISKCNFRGF